MVLPYRSSPRLPLKQLNIRGSLSCMLNPRASCLSLGDKFRSLAGQWLCFQALGGLLSVGYWTALAHPACSCTSFGVSISWVYLAWQSETNVRSKNFLAGIHVGVGMSTVWLQKGNYLGLADSQMWLVSRSQTTISKCRWQSIYFNCKMWPKFEFLSQT